MRDFGYIVLIFSLMMLPISSGCAGSKWKDYSYGPGDWVNDNTALKVDTMGNYERLIDPVITVTVVDSVVEACGGYAVACAQVSRDHCEVFVGERASAKTLAHEYRHCHGWTHYVPRNDVRDEDRTRELRLAQSWYPMTFGL